MLEKIAECVLIETSNKIPYARARLRDLVADLGLKKEVAHEIRTRVGSHFDGKSAATLIAAITKLADEVKTQKNNGNNEAMDDIRRALELLREEIDKSQEEEWLKDLEVMVAELTTHQAHGRDGAGSGRG